MPHPYPSIAQVAHRKDERPVTGTRARRFAATLSAALLGLMVLGPAATLASPPGWNIINLKKLPAVVQPGNDAGYSFTITNQGKSNISQLYLTDTIAVPPTYLTSTRAGCVTSPRLSCSFGALAPGDTIDIVIAYATPTTGNSFDVTFELNGTGNTPSDGGTSHGDTLTASASTALNSSQNFAGGFSPAAITFLNNQVLDRTNVQSGKVTAPGAHLPVTLEDGLADNAFNCSSVPQCSTRFGEWARLEVANGATFSNGIHVTITVFSKNLKPGASTTNINLIHVPASGSPHVISLRCNGSTTLDAVASGPECITVTPVGKNFQIDAYLLSNGGLRGV